MSDPSLIGKCMVFFGNSSLHICIICHKNGYGKVNNKNIIFNPPTLLCRSFENDMYFKFNKFFFCVVKVSTLLYGHPSLPLSLWMSFRGHKVVLSFNSIKIYTLIILSCLAIQQNFNLLGSI